MHLLRRGHLYLGLLLFPWAILYGVTAFLFNHPTAVPDQPTVQFGREALVGTPMASLPQPRDLAEQVVAKLNDKFKPAVPYTLGMGEVKYAREFTFATVKTDDRTVSVLMDMKGSGGTVRSAERKAEPVTPPFVVGSGGGSGGRTGRGGGGPRAEADRPRANGLVADGEPMAARIQASITTVLERIGFPSGSVTVTSIPDLVFPLKVDGTTWTATYNPLTGSVGGAPAEAHAGMGWRQFVLRLHTAHGYPGDPNARWWWAVVVDVMAAVMVFWGLSGLLMWWQIKATRWVGAVVLVLSAVAATAMGFAMYAAMAT